MQSEKQPDERGCGGEEQRAGKGGGHGSRCAHQMTRPLRTVLPAPSESSPQAAPGSLSDQSCPHPSHGRSQAPGDHAGCPGEGRGGRTDGSARVLLRLAGIPEPQRLRAGQHGPSPCAPSGRPLGGLWSASKTSRWAGGPAGGQHPGKGARHRRKGPDKGRTGATRQAWDPLPAH